MTDDRHASGYDFVQLGEGMTRSLLAAAEEQVAKAQQILDQTRSMTDIIMTQVRAQATQIEEMNARFKAFGEQMLDAHRKLDGGLPAAPQLDPAGLRSIAAGVRADPAVVRQANAAANAGFGADRRRAEDPDGHADVQRTVAARQRFAAGHAAQRQRPDSGDPDPAF